MNQSVFVSIIIGIVGIVFTYLIYRIQQIRRYPGKLTFTIKEFFRVMRNVPGNYQNLSLTYENYQVKDNLLYIIFYILNMQSYDCSCTNHSQPIIIEVPEGVKWIDTKIAKQSQGVESECFKINDRELGITINLLRDKEFLKIDALLESSIDLDQDELQEKKCIKHRIPNFDEVKKVSVLSASGVRKTKRRIRMPIMMVIFTVVAIVFTLLFKNNTSPLKYTEISSGIERMFYLNKSNELVYLKSTIPWARFSDPISKEAFLQDYTVSWTRDTHISNGYYYFIIVLYGIMALLMCVLVIMELHSLRKTKRIDEITKEKSLKADSHSIAD